MIIIDYDDIAPYDNDSDMHHDMQDVYRQLRDIAIKHNIAVMIKPWHMPIDSIADIITLNHDEADK
jgi:hypothetical protein